MLRARQAYDSRRPGGVGLTRLASWTFQKLPIMPQAPASATRHAFVYGTLRRGDDNDINRLQPAPVFVGEARIKGRMYHLGRYPGVLLGGPHDVAGEVYAISAELERVLDEIEELYPQQTNGISSARSRWTSPGGSSGASSMKSIRLWCRASR